MKEKQRVYKNEDYSIKIIVSFVEDKIKVQVLDGDVLQEVLEFDNEEDAIGYVENYLGLQKGSKVNYGGNIFKVEYVTEDKTMAVLKHINYSYYRFARIRELKVIE